MGVIPRLWSDIKHDARSVARGAVAAPRTAATIAQDTLSLMSSTASAVTMAAVHAPQTLATWQRIASAIWTGQHTLLPARLPAYTPLAPGLAAAAKVRGSGQTQAQRVLTNKDGGAPSEPMTLMVTGSKDDMVRALRSQGWHLASGPSVNSFLKMGGATITRLFNDHTAPVSPQYLDGQLPAVVMEKNNDAGLGRDHMRIYAAGTDPATGQPRWAIAASRDTEAAMTVYRPIKHGFWPWQWTFRQPGFGHETDLHADPERDMIMHDLLASGQVSAWQAVKGRPVGVKSGPAPGGLENIGRYTSDGQVYKVSLGSP